MHAWPAPHVPALPGVPVTLCLFDTSTGRLHETPRGAPGRRARIYVCGITPYDATHLGHAATYLAFDLVQRMWLDAGHGVTYVQNVTDVDDPLLERAHRDGEDWRELAERETALFREDMTALRVLPPEHYIGAVEAIPIIVESIQELRRRGAAYDVDGDVYFPVSSDTRFGSVSLTPPGQMAALFAERGGDPERPGKKDPLDCLLWQAARPGEPSWDSELGPGRPGWHIECTAIALRYLGMGFDVQGGGSDLAFPHHEMGAAHAHALTGGWPFAETYAHAGMVGLDGAKMSKSKGNLVFVSALRAEGVDPAAIRIALLAHHYRSDWEWTPGELDRAVERLARWRAARLRPASASDLLADVRRALAADLDAPAALDAVDAWAERSLLGTGGHDAKVSYPAGTPARAPESAPDLAERAINALLGIGF